MKLAIDIFGCTMETLTLAYFYKKMMGKTTINKNNLIILYLCAGVMMVLVSTNIQESILKIFFLILFVISPLFVYKEKIKFKLILAVMYFVAQAMSEWLTKAISLSIYGDVNILQENFLQNYLFGVVFSKLLALLIIFIITAVVRIKETKIPFHMFLLLFVIPLISMISIYGLKTIYYTFNLKEYYLGLTILIVILILVNLILFYFFDRMMELNNLKTQVIVSEALLIEQKLYYDKLTKQQEEIRSLSHDMNNKLFILSGYINDGNFDAVNKYIQDIQKEIAENKPVITGYSVLDMVLASKKELATKQETTFDITFFIITELTIDIADVAIVIANCLDNALEATAKIAETGNRYILLDMKTKGNYLLIKVSNTVVEKVEIYHNKIKTSKIDFLHHGFGLRNVEKIADKHDGSLRLECNNNLFVASVMLRLDDLQSQLE